ncbi:Zinc transporter ZIP9 [Caligus rogercresseyi]|uniref:Zinc transporter ZIP9 n=1 Tax=Caligus rogercresseyi TaxID=217165 RepID=A0A7T8HF87_CALRO|nr:Zinc transporter ZIP9 [Caligus rogercresseyi]
MDRQTKIKLTGVNHVNKSVKGHPPLQRDEEEIVIAKHRIVSECQKIRCFSSKVDIVVRYLHPYWTMEELTIFSVVMLFGSYLAGSIPLFLKMVSVLGAGLLLGTALTVIIPEGILTLIKGYSPHTEAIDKPIGIALVLGFLFMLLVDQIASHASSENTSSKKLSWTTTLGLVVHAAADGIALGAAATTNQTDVEIIVFLAIMLHKAPAAFGLVTYLLQQGLDRNKARKHLIIFALSAPPPTSGGGSDTIGATGIAMLFSAGTFLYVATIHVLPERNLGILQKGTLFPCGGSSSTPASHPRP